MTNLSPLNYWLIGFTEAEGYFVVGVRGDMSFVISQDYRNIFILYYIQDTLGFGRIIKQSSKVFSYVVQDQVGLSRIISLFNGHLVLSKKKLALESFINAYNLRYNFNIVFNERFNLPTLNDAWISGFTDGDGCFNISFIELKDRFYIRFILSQKEDITFLKEIFGLGSIEVNSTNQCYSFVIKDLCTSKSYNNKIVIDYFSKFPLKTYKLNSYLLWKYIMGQLYNTKATPEKIAGLKSLCKLINNAD